MSHFLTLPAANEYDTEDPRVDPFGVKSIAETEATGVTVLGMMGGHTIRVAMSVSEVEAAVNTARDTAHGVRLAPPAQPGPFPHPVPGLAGRRGW